MRATSPARAAESAASTQARQEPLLVVILGPTGSGKTALSLALAERFQGEIVNCDSVALYCEVEIGTAKPTAAERARVPHHLFDIAGLDEAVTAGDYARRTRVVLAEIAGRGRIPIVVGGTGFYLRALLEGLFSGPPRAEELRQRLRARATKAGKATKNDPAGLHRLLQRLDPAAAAKIHANDTPKLIRAIEVGMQSREKMSELWQRGREPLTGFRVLRIGLDPERNALYARINERARHMFDSGLVEETRALLAKYGDARPLQSLGYKQAGQLLRGEIDRKLAIWATQQAHRNYAKRQMTWFRREPEVHWLKSFGDVMQIQSEAMDLVQSAASRTAGGDCAV
ncbi:MAG TPA: tRNA (adenosine(37)-N6)-dimethylallyltransferase MiaA [Terriglobales bacterium]|nr:tRNA (adenosine(37)-N6)-dimethylallyltransferase MiaA [Terriglobales bacterium]